MAFHGTPNGGMHSPATRERDQPHPRCCAACIRGTRALPGPCAYPNTCRCHHRERSTR